MVSHGNWTLKDESKGSSEEEQEGEVFWQFPTMSDGVRRPEGSKRRIEIGDFLPCGPRMYHETNDNIVRMRDIAIKRRVLLVGVLGSFTPDCWNRHLYLVLDRLPYFRQRQVDYICCVSTNDAYVHRAWGAYLGCQDAVLMWADPTRRFTKAIGMDVVVPWLDDSVRSQRYIILADDLQVTKLLIAPNDHLEFAWECCHFKDPGSMCEEEEEDDDQWT